MAVESLTKLGRFVRVVMTRAWVDHFCVLNQRILLSSAFPLSFEPLKLFDWTLERSWISRTPCMKCGWESRWVRSKWWTSRPTPRRPCKERILPFPRGVTPSKRSACSVGMLYCSGSPRRPMSRRQRVQIWYFETGKKYIHFWKLLIFQKVKIPPKIADYDHIPYFTAVMMVCYYL